MKHGFTPTSWLLLCGVLLTAPGCTYSWGGPYRKNISTVYVDMFESREFRREIEFKLTEALKKRIGSDTPYRLAPRERADTILTGEVIEVRQNAFAQDPRTRQPREEQLTLTVRIQWRDLRNGKMLADVPMLSASVDYLPVSPAVEYAPGVRQTPDFAIEKSVDRMAQQIVARMYEEW